MKMKLSHHSTRQQPVKSELLAILQMLGFSILGIGLFFIPFEIGGKKTIAFDHIASYLVAQQRTLAVVLLFVLMVYGVISPIITGLWRRSFTDGVLTLFKVAGLVLAILYIAQVAPDGIMAKDMMPFLFEKLALPVGMIVPIGALMLSFLLGFGLLEMMGVLMQPVMRPIFKTPGMSAIDAVASFVGSYSVALLITDRVYRQGQYSAKEAVIIATGFSTVSTAFMVIVAKTLGLMSVWNFYFWSCLIITFVVTAITARLPPIKNMDNTHAREASDEAKSGIKDAWQAGLDVAKRSDGLVKILWSNLFDGIKMAAAIVPSIISIGLLGLILAKYTPLFDVLGVALYPFTYIGGLSEPMLVAKGLSSGLAEMFLPALLLADADVLTRYVTAVVSISAIIFFSAMIPCVLATSIPVSVGKLVLLWFVRTALSILLACAVGHWAMGMGWLL